MYRRHYYGLLSEWADIKDETFFGLDSGVAAAPFVPGEIERQFDPYIPEANRSLTFEYEFTTDTLIERLGAYVKALEVQTEAMSKLLAKPPRVIPNADGQTLWWKQDPNTVTDTRQITLNAAQEVKSTGEIPVEVIERGIKGGFAKVKRRQDEEIRWVEERFLREDGGSNPIFTGGFGDIDLFAQKVDDVLAFPGLLWDNSKNIITGLGTNVNVHLHNLGLGANERTGLFVLESEQNPNKTVTVQDMILKNI
ncbi:MAG: hypothetical protein UY48_C0057G0004, partial [Candidatus Gottesmanbacteria bacterium GW2011_GWB1_49_7]